MARVPQEKTIVILDVENGSVAAALVRTAVGKPPKLYAEERVHIPVLNTRDATRVMKEVSRALRDVLQHVSLVAARMRHNEKTVHLGTIARIEVFLSAPWTAPKNGTTAPWVHESAVMEQVREAVEEYFNNIPVHFHAFAPKAGQVLGGLFPYEQNALVLSVTGEVAELLLLKDKVAVSHATMPVGKNTLARTLRASGGLSSKELFSALALSSEHEEDPAQYKEILQTTREHFLDAFMDSAEDILGGTAPSSVFVIAEAPLGQWFSKAIAGHNTIGYIFPEGAAVRTIQHAHLAPYCELQTAKPDLILTLEAVCANTHQ